MISEHLDIVILSVIYILIYSKKDPEVLTKILPCLQMMLEDENVNVQKKVILTLPPVFRVVIQVIKKV